MQGSGRRSDKITANPAVQGKERDVPLKKLKSLTWNLTFSKERSGNPVHVVWGVLKGLDNPAVLVTAYRPDPERRAENFLRRCKR